MLCICFSIWCYKLFVKLTFAIPLFWTETSKWFYEIILISEENWCFCLNFKLFSEFVTSSLNWAWMSKKGRVLQLVALKYLQVFCKVLLHSYALNIDFNDGIIVRVLCFFESWIQSVSSHSRLQTPLHFSYAPHFYWSKFLSFLWFINLIILNAKMQLF